MIENPRHFWLHTNKLTSSTCVGSEFTPRTGIESSMKWLACKSVPSPPTVTTKSTFRMGCDRLLRNIGSQSTDFFCKIFSQKFVASLWTLRLLSRYSKTWNVLKRNRITRLKITDRVKRKISPKGPCGLTATNINIIDAHFILYTPPNENQKSKTRKTCNQRIKLMLSTYALIGPEAKALQCQYVMYSNKNEYKPKKP